MLEGLEVVGEWPEWHRDAACAEYAEHSDWWFPERGESTEPAKAICQTCLVQSDCLGWALAQGASSVQGIWGGTSERERKRLRAGGITGELVRKYGVHAVQGGKLERERERDREWDARRWANYSFE